VSFHSEAACVPLSSSRPCLDVCGPYVSEFFCVGSSFATGRSTYQGTLTVDWGARGGIVVTALRYKPACRGFDSRWSHWNFSVT
jgi:hypothetical protein